MEYKVTTSSNGRSATVETVRETVESERELIQRVEYKVTTSSNGRSATVETVREMVESERELIQQVEYNEYQVIPEIILCSLGGGGGVVRHRGRVKGDLGVFLDVSTPRQQSQLRWGGGGGGGGTVQGEGEGGIWGKKRLLSSVPLVSVLETSHCTCKRQNLLVLFLPAGAQR